MGLFSARQNFRATERSKIATWAKNSPVWSHCLAQKSRLSLFTFFKTEFSRNELRIIRKKLNTSSDKN